MTRRFFILPQLALLFFGISLGGCSALDNCPDERDDVVEITQCPDDEPDCNRATGVYASAPWEGPRDPFPAKTMMRFAHGLGTTPELAMTYVSFTAEGTDVTENAGNQGRIRCVDNDAIWIKNDTCEEAFYVRVAAWASGTKDTACSCEQRFEDPDSCPAP